MTHRENILEKYELPIDKSYSLEELSQITSKPLDVLQEVYNRGIGAYKTNPKSVRMKGSYEKNVDAPMSKKLSKEQWAMARVYSFLDNNPEHDNDLRLEGGLKPITARVGGKVLLKKKIINEYFPPSSSYNTYVEPFVGGGSVYFYKNKDDHKEVVNDLDPSIYELFKGFQKYANNDFANDVNGNYTEKDFEDIKKSKPSTDYKKFLKTYLLYKLSYFGRGELFGKPRINTSFNGYEERLKNTDILNKDYKEVIKKYDSPKTFFYLDPPVREQTGKFNFPAININELAEVCKNIKGKFLLSLADTSINKKLFSGFNIISIPTKYVGTVAKGGQLHKANEYLIMNYKLSITGSGNGEEVIEVKKTLPLHEASNEFIDFMKKPARAQLGKPDIKDFQSFITVNDYYIMPVDGTACSRKDAEVMIQLALPGIDYPIDYSQALKQLKGTYGYTIDRSKQDFSLIDPDGFTIAFGEGAGINGMKKLHRQLRKNNISHDQYMKAVGKAAKKTGYDPKMIEMATDGNHKLQYTTPDGTIVPFGKVNYNDYIIYTLTENEDAENRRDAYLARATKIKGNWKDNKYSPNNLAINILW